MFREYKDHKGIDVPMLSKILKANEGGDWAAIVFENADLETSVAVVEFDLVLAFKFLVDALANSAVAMDAYLAEYLGNTDLSFKTSVMSQFVKFRRLNGLEIAEDDAFESTSDLNVYVIKKKCEGCGKVKPIGDVGHDQR